ncbi:putative nucleotidyltransferase, ribonuclease H [Tanacetum coccineum]
MTMEEARVVPDVVSGTFLVNNLNAQVLFDSGANRSFVSTSFSQSFDQGIKKLDKEIMVELATMLKIKSPNGEVICIYGDRKSRGLNLISMMKTIKCLRKGCKAYLAYVTKARELEKKEVSNIHVVCDFPDVFPDDLPGIPPERQVEFRIDLIPGATPIAKAPYRLAPIEMQELMK